jgi:hypothetical protein
MTIRLSLNMVGLLPEKMRGVIDSVTSATN